MTDVAADLEAADLEDIALGSSCVALLGERGGRYPDANALLVRGAERTALIEAPLGVRPRVESLPEIDLVILSHCHEDHLPALPLLPGVPCWVHREDALGLRSMADFNSIFGVEPERRESFEQRMREVFFYEPRPGAETYEDGHLWDLGGGVTIRAIHTPGHTRGHCSLLVEPDGVVYLGDIDLSTFGPYYGDAWSDLEDFERSIQKIQDLEANHYLSGHHLGVVDPATYRERIRRYGERIVEREERLLEFLSEPRSMAEIVAHRFIYRPHDQAPHIDHAERVSMGLHLERLLRDGAVQKSDGRYRAV